MFSRIASSLNPQHVIKKLARNRGFKNGLEDIYLLSEEVALLTNGVPFSSELYFVIKLILKIWIPVPTNLCSSVQKVVFHCGNLSPLFLSRSESPSQVFIIVISWLFTILKAMNPLHWSNVYLAYDNMCHLDGLKAARKPLPFSSPWDKAWMSINKIIDKLHIRNHKDTSCKEKYNPSSLKEEIPEGNTMAAEQTFVWLSRFKKIVCAMPKVHHLFYLHRMVKRRNKYTVNCYKSGKKPLLPRAGKTVN